MQGEDWASGWWQESSADRYHEPTARPSPSTDQPSAGWGYSYMDHTGAYYMAIAILMALIVILHIGTVAYLGYAWAL